MARKFAGRECSNLYFTHYANRRLFSREWLFSLDNAELFPIAAIPPITAVLGEKYVICAPQHNCRDLLLGVLKENLEQLPTTP